MDGNGPLALSLGGGGARAAWQVGLLRGIAKRHPDLQIPILTGVSAGAINIAFLASSSEGLPATLDRVAGLWMDLTPDRVFKSNFWAMARNAMRWGVRLGSGGSPLGRQTRGLLDTAPLREFLIASMCTGPEGALPCLEQNLDTGRLRAVGLTTTNYGTGQSITWVAGRDVPMWTRPHRRSVLTRLTVDHVLASSALPLFFPAVEIDGTWHGDGGVRLTAPLSPALHLGAGRILAVSTRYKRSQDEADAPTIQGYPPPAQVMGVLMNAIFLDMMDYDAMVLDRVNRLLHNLPEEQRNGLRPVELLTLRPSRDLASIATQYEPRLPQPFRFLLRGLGTRESKSPDSLSMVMFEPQYVQHLIELGELDAEARADEIAAFLGGA